MDDVNCGECGLPITDDDRGIRVYRKADASDSASTFEREIVDTDHPCYVHHRCFNSREYMRT